MVGLGKLIVTSRAVKTPDMVFSHNHGISYEGDQSNAGFLSPKIQRVSYFAEKTT